MFRLPSYAAGLLVVVLAGALLTACGGDDEADTGATGATGAESADPAPSDELADADARAVARIAQTALEAHAVDNGSYAGVDQEALGELDATLLDAEISTLESDDRTYTVGITSSTGTEFVVERQRDGTTVLSCSDPGVGACESDGSW